MSQDSFASLDDDIEDILECLQQIQQPYVEGDWTEPQDKHGDINSVNRGATSNGSTTHHISAENGGGQYKTTIKTAKAYDRSDSLLSRIAGPSSNKPGIDQAKRDDIAKAIIEISKGSPFFQNELRKVANTDKKIQELLIEKQRILDVKDSPKIIAQETVLADQLLDKLRTERDLSQVIVHIDMDMFFAAVEIKKRSQSERCSDGRRWRLDVVDSQLCCQKIRCKVRYARVHCKKICPQLIIIPPNYDAYRIESMHVRQVLEKYDPSLSTMSLDEAYLNITEAVSTFRQTPEKLVEQMRQEIFDTVQLTASAGIGPNTMIAKICSDINKSNGQIMIPPDEKAIQEFMNDLPIRKIPGIGRVTERILNCLGCHPCKDLYTERAMLRRLLTPLMFNFVMRAYLGLGQTSVENDWSESQEALNVPSPQCLPRQS